MRQLSHPSVSGEREQEQRYHDVDDAGGGHRRRIGLRRGRIVDDDFDIGIGHG